MADWPYNTSAWQRLRRAKLDETPLCEPCGMRGKPMPARVVDHVLAIAKGGDPFPPLSGLMSMCPSCHSDKTNALDNPRAAGSRPGVAFKGCDVNGMPVDASHPFFGGDTPSQDGDRRPSDRFQSPK